jgi:hypothetical protein
MAFSPGNWGMSLVDQYQIKARKSTEQSSIRDDRPILLVVKEYLLQEL